MAAEQAVPEVAVPFRGIDPASPAPFNATSFEDVYGKIMGHDLMPGESAAPVVVRFQGARVSGDLPTLCDVDVTDPTVPIINGSLTPWVDHPTKLNDHPIAPNIVRWHRTEARPAVAADYPAWTPPAVRAAFAASGVDRSRPMRSRPCRCGSVETLAWP